MRKKWKRGAALLLCGVLLLLCGCSTYVTLGLPEMEKYREEVLEAYGDVVKDMTIQCDPSGLQINFDMTEAKEETVLALTAGLKQVVGQTSFVEHLMQGFSKNFSGDYNWKNGYRPSIYIYYNVDGKNVYNFWTLYFKEPYLRGDKAENYTYDGYATWYGYDYDHEREFSSEELEKLLSVN